MVISSRFKILGQILPLALGLWFGTFVDLQAQTTPKLFAATNQSSNQAEALIAAGIAAFERDELEAAKVSFQKVLTLKPNVTALTYLGLIADRAGDLDEAEQRFSAAAKLAPELSSARNNYGAILLRKGQLNPAAAQFEASLKLDPNQLNALINLAQIRFASGSSSDLRSAGELFARAYNLKPDAELARALTIVSLRRQEYAEAPGLYRKYAKHLSEETESSVVAAPARAELGAALFEAGLLDEAETELTEAVKLDPGSLESIMRLGRVYLARKDLSAAGRTLEASVARGVDSAPLYALLAEVYEKSGHFENAIPAMRLAIQRDPESEKYRFAYGILLMNANVPAAAIIRLEEALKQFPRSSRLWFALGLAHFKQQQLEKATSAFEQALQLDPKFAPAFAYLGLTRVTAGFYSEAISFYKKALEADPKLAVVHYLIADVQLKQVDADSPETQKHLQRSVELDPTFTLARMSLAKLFMRAKQWDSAITELESVIRLEPTLSEAYYHLGRAYGRVKRTNDAETALETFKRLSETAKTREESELREIVKRLADVRF